MDAYDYWKEKFKARPKLEIYISDYLQKNSTKEDRDAHIDIADWLLRYMFGPAPAEADKWHQEFLKAAKFISPDKHEEVEALIRDLGLEFMGAEKVRERGKRKQPKSLLISPIPEGVGAF